MKTISQVYIVTDDDTGEARAFAKRKNAINMMYHKCKDWGAPLYISVKNHGLYQYTDISKLYPTEQEQLEYLYLSEISELNKIFECYWYIQKCDIEDAE